MHLEANVIKNKLVTIPQPSYYYNKQLTFSRSHYLFTCALEEICDVISLFQNSYYTFWVKEMIVELGNEIYTLTGKKKFCI